MENFNIIYCPLHHNRETLQLRLVFFANHFYFETLFGQELSKFHWYQHSKIARLSRN